jgi:hypothetical protein
MVEPQIDPLITLSISTPVLIKRISYITIIQLKQNRWKSIL